MATRARATSPSRAARRTRASSSSGRTASASSMPARSSSSSRTTSRAGPWGSCPRAGTLRSHTGALASDGAAIDAACHAAGMHRVNAPQELLDLAQGLLGAGPLRGRRVAVLTDGGGHGGVAAALAAAAGLELPALSPNLREALRAGLPPTAAVANPVDLAGGGERDIRSYDRVARAVLASGEVDALLMSGYFGGYTDHTESLAP